MTAFEFRTRGCKPRWLVASSACAIILIISGGFPAQQRPGAVEVRVSEDPGEEPSFRADVRLYTFGRGTHTHRAFTDGGGRVTFLRVERGNYVVEVEKPDYEPYRGSVDVPPGSHVTVFAHLRSKTEAAGTSSRQGIKVSARQLAVPETARREYELGAAKLKKQPKKSIGHFRKAIRLHPAFAEAYAMMGLAYLQIKDETRALSALGRALELDPDVALAFTVRGKLHLEGRNFDEAEKDLREALRLDPRSWSANFHLSRCYFNTGRLDDALGYARRARDLPDALPESYLLLADIYLRKGDRANALRELEQFVSAAPNSAFLPRVLEKIEELSRQP